MSRYRKVLSGEAELPEIEGTKFVIYQTLDTRMELLELVKASQAVDEIDEKDAAGNVVLTRRAKGVGFRMKSVAEICAKVIFEGCFDHDTHGKRLKQKEEFSSETFESILALVIESSPLSIYMELCIALGIFDKEIG